MSVGSVKKKMGFVERCNGWRGGQVAIVDGGRQSPLTASPIAAIVMVIYRYGERDRGEWCVRER